MIVFAAVLVWACRGERVEKVSAGAAVNAPVIIISVDTLRADHLPAYGYKQVETPAIDALRADSILFANAYSHCPLTLPSHVSMLTGLLPADAGVRDNIGYSVDAAKPSVPRLLKERGYVTGAAVSAYVLRSSTGMGDLFDFYDDRVAMRPGDALGNLQRPGSETAAIALQWIERNSSSPFFMLLHLFEPHTPYAPPEPFRSQYAQRPYDGEIAAADAVIGTFIQRLKELGIYDRAVVLLMSDHGEGLGDHGEEEHGVFLYREAIHIPLMLKLPKSQRGGERTETAVQLIDVLPTITSLVGATTPAGLRGSTLVGAPETRPVFAETMYPRIHLGWSELRSLVAGDFHYIDAPRPELYNLRSDPGEKRNVVENERPQVASMRKVIAPLRVGLEAITIDPEAAAKLTALGYIGAASTTAAGGPLADPKDRIAEVAMMQAAGRATSERRYDDAIVKWKELLAVNPRSTDAWTRLAQTYENAGRPEDAVAAYRRTIELTPSMAGPAALSLASVYLKMGEYDKARDHAQLGASSNRAAASLILGRAALAKKDLPAADTHARAAMSDANYRHGANVLRAQLLTAGRKPQEALVLLDEVKRELEASGQTPIDLLEFARGDALARLNRVREAEHAFKEEIRFHPGDRDAYASLAVLYLLQGNVDSARATMRALVDRNPSPAAYDLAADTFQHFRFEREAAEWRARKRSRTEP